MIKMLVCDIDGTICMDGAFSDATVECIDRVRRDGIKFVIATGRTYLSAIKVLEPLKIDTPIICYQGGLIRMPNNGEVIAEHLLKRDLALEIIDYLKTEGIYPNIYINGNLCTEKDTDTVRAYSKYQNIPYTVIPDVRKEDFKGVNKLLAVCHDPIKMDRIVKTLQERYKDRIYNSLSTPYFCEICDINVSKGNALTFLANKWGIKKEEIMGCGDEGNDIELLQASGIGVAMGNATEKLKQIADYVTDTIGNDGVAKAVGKFIYGKNDD